jgi:vancomycin permeability regulator SanA
VGSDNENSGRRHAPGWLRILRTLLVLAAVASLALAAYGLLARPRPADVAIVFGNTVSAGGQPSPRLVARLETARGLRTAGMVRTLFVSGGIGREGYDESRAMRDWLVHHGVPRSAVVRDSLGTNSEATAAHARAWMAAHDAATAVIVTQYFHVARASLACRAAGIRITGAAAPRWFEPRDAYSIARELAALPVYAVRGLSSLRPQAPTANAAGAAAKTGK